jgi:putative oxidoreductase
MTSSLNKYGYSNIILFGIRITLGVIFVYASYHKIEDPSAFAKILYGYDLFPGITINIIAITIPFIELLTGFCLIFGLYPRSAVFIINALLLCFILAISINLIRGHEFDCGCFGSNGTDSTAATVYLLIRDLICFMAGVYYLKKVRNA